MPNNTIEKDIDAAERGKLHRSSLVERSALPFAFLDRVLCSALRDTTDSERSSLLPSGAAASRLPFLLFRLPLDLFGVP